MFFLHLCSKRRRRRRRRRKTLARECKSTRSKRRRRRKKKEAFRSSSFAASFEFSVRWFTFARASVLRLRLRFTSLVKIGLYIFLWPANCSEEVAIAPYRSTWRSSLGVVYSTTFDSAQLSNHPILFLLFVSSSSPIYFALHKDSLCLFSFTKYSELSFKYIFGSNCMNVMADQNQISNFYNDNLT